MKHSDTTLGSAPPPSAAAREWFGDQLGVAERYASWLVGAGIERGIIGPGERDRIWDRHLLNSAVVGRFISSESAVLDIGSGGGLPGVVLALLQPTSEVTLLEPMLRRVEFLEEVVDDLQLANVAVVRGRADESAPVLPTRFEVVTARAVAPLARLAAWSIPLVAPGGKVLALKGTNAAQELAEAGPALDRLGICERTIHEVEVAGTVTHIVDLAVPSAMSRRPQGGRGDQ